MAYTEFKAQVDAVEECYELMLAYAAQGLESDRDSPNGSELRQKLEAASEALEELPRTAAQLAPTTDRQAIRAYHEFIDVLERDATTSRAAIQLVRSQEAISSQLIDNLNASIHLRALLTDLFLLDELVRPTVTKS